jgi:hypothetical protein
MPWFSRIPKDLVTSGDLARYGRFQLLGAELSGVADYIAVSALLDPLRNEIYGGDPQAKLRATEEIRRHAQQGEWEAVGAWKFSRDAVPDADLERDMTDAALLALARMRMTNLAIHLGPAHLRRYEELTTEPAPNDGFFGPPVFDSNFGPTRQYYFDHAISAAAARNPSRLASHPGVAPGPIEDAARSMWDFGSLVLRGPLLVSPEIQFEPSVVRRAVAAATDVDHGLFADALHADLDGKKGEGFTGWYFMGAARFLEDYLAPELTGTPVHAAFADAGLQELTTSGWLGRTVCVDVLSPFERERL